MMKHSTRIAPPNSLVLVSDPGGGDIPGSMNQSLIAATDSCIAIGCRAEDDGETEIDLGLSNCVNTGDEPAFEGTLKTPNRKIAVRDVLGVVLLEMAVPAAETIVRIWVNDSKEPDKIIVGIM